MSKEFGLYHLFSSRETQSLWATHFMGKGVASTSTISSAHIRLHSLSATPQPQHTGATFVSPGKGSHILAPVSWYELTCNRMQTLYVSCQRFSQHEATRQFECAHTHSQLYIMPLTQGAVCLKKITHSQCFHSFYEGSFILTEGLINFLSSFLCIDVIVGSENSHPVTDITVSVSQLKSHMMFFSFFLHWEKKAKSKNMKVEMYRMVFPSVLKITCCCLQTVYSMVLCLHDAMLWHQTVRVKVNV